MRISNRLEALTFFVPYNSKVIDVGTDHALLPIYLIENDLVVYSEGDCVSLSSIKSPK